MRNRTPENVAGTEEKNEARPEKQSSDKLWVLEDCVTFIFLFQAFLKTFKSQPHPPLKKLQIDMGDKSRELCCGPHSRPNQSRK